ncbi:MAG TPA: hypothetical protein ENN80_08485, partial [Candidatus Hydrogenedentes bacterium]|nr:hypothetical protein [Candidatus Hydrogenedentota bacterium]
RGGGMYNWRTPNTVVVANCVFGSNQANMAGGAVQNEQALVQFIDCRFVGNVVLGNDVGLRGGGAMFNNLFASVTVERCLFDNNDAQATSPSPVGAGGAIYNWSSLPTIKECRFDSNTAAHLGGGVYNASDALNDVQSVLTNCIFYENAAGGDGGGFYAFWSDDEITNCTFASNHVTSGSGGAVYNMWGSDLTVLNSILWGNDGAELVTYAGGGPGWPANVPTATMDYSDYDGGWVGGTGNINLNPNFANLAIGDLQINSAPCINVASATGAPSNDIIRTVRPQQTGYDMGAYEYDPALNAPSCASIVIQNAPVAPGEVEVEFLVTFSELVAGVDLSDFGFTTTGTVTVGPTTVDFWGVHSGEQILPDNQWMVRVNTGTMDGTLRLNLLNNGSITDMAGNVLTAGLSSAVHTVDTIDPTVLTINRSAPAQQNTNAAQVTFAVTFDEPVDGVTVTNFGLTTTGDQATASIAGVNGAGPTATWTVDVDTVAGLGDIRLDLTNTTGIEDEAANPLAGAHVGDQLYSIDRVVPSVDTIQLDGSPSANSVVVHFLVTFDEDVEDVDTDDFSVVTTGDVYVAPTITGVDTYPTGGGTQDNQWRVTVNTGDMEGTIGLDVVLTGATPIVDLVGNALAAGLSSGPLHDPVDTHKPTIVDGPNLLGSPVENAATVDFVIEFSEDVDGVALARSAGDFTVNASGVVTTPPAVAGVESYPVPGETFDTQWVITVSTGIMEGDIGLTLTPTSANIKDFYDNPLTVGAASGLVHTVDTIVPTCDSLTADAGTGPTNADTIAFTAVFSENVVGFDATDLLVTVTGTVTYDTPVMIPATGPTDTYTVQFPNVAGDGTLSFAVATGIGVQDEANNGLGSSVGSDIVMVDNTAPTVVLGTPVLTPPNANGKVNRFGEIRVLVTYSGADSVTLAVGDVVVTPSGTASVGGVSVTGSGTVSREIVLTNCTGDGDLIISIDPATSSDVAGNADIGPLAPADAVTVDNTGPTVTIDPATPLYVNASTPVDFAVHFGGGDLDTVNFSTQDDIVITTGPGIFGDPTVTIIDPDTADPIVRLTNCTGNGEIYITVKENKAFDDLGNANGVEDSDPVTVDNIKPTVPNGKITHVYGTAPTAATSIDFLVEFSEYVENFETSAGQNGGEDVVVTHAIGVGNNTAHNGVTITPSGDGIHYTVTVYGIHSTDGNPAHGSITIAAAKADVPTPFNPNADTADRAGNGLFWSYTSPPVYIDRNLVSVERITPDVTGPTNVTEINYEVEFSSNVENFDPTDLVFTTTGSVTFNSGAVTVTPAVGPEDVYTVTLPGIAGTGTIDWAFDVNNDIAKEGTGAELSGDLTGPAPIEIDNTGPSAIAIVPETTGPTALDDLEFTITFDQVAYGFDSVDDLIIGVTGAVTYNTPGITIVPASESDTFVVTIAGIENDGTLNLAVDITSDVVDALGNPMVSSVTSADVTFIQDQESPECVSIAAVTPTLTQGGDVQYAVAFSEPVQGFNNYLDLNVNKTGTVTYDTTGVLIVGNTAVLTAYTVTFRNVGGDGNLSFSVRTTSDVRDLVGNPLVSSVMGDVVTMDNTRPEILFSQPNPAVTVDGPVTYTVTYSDLHPGTVAPDLTPADILLTNIGGKAAPTVQVDVISTTQATVTISDLHGSDLGLGDITIQITREGTYFDLVGNSAPISGQSPPFRVEEQAEVPLEWFPLLLALLAVGILSLGVWRWGTTRR